MTWISFAITVFASLVHGVIGIGFPMIATPLLAMTSDVRSAVLLLVLPTTLINLVNILKGGNWSESLAKYWPLAVYGMLGSIVGTRLLIFLPPEPFRLLLAGMLVVYLNVDRLGGGFAWVHRHHQLAFAVFGFAAGVLAGTVNVMLPALIILGLELRLAKNVMIQVFNLCFLVGKVTQGVVLAQAGLMTADVLKHSIPMALLALVVMLLGMRVREKIPSETYRRWLRLLLMLLAAMLVVQYVVSAVSG